MAVAPCQSSVSCRNGECCRKERLVLVNGPAFLLKIFSNRASQALVGEVMQAVGLHRQIAPRQLVLPCAPASTRASLCWMAKSMA